jgi:putative endonuclease
MSYSVYILYSKLKDRYYVGYSKDVNLRLEKHNLGATVSTRPSRPWILVYKEDFANKSDAIRREKYIKKQKSKIFIENLIRYKK